MRAGALAAPMEIVEKRVVDPSLGHDSIRGASQALLYGSILVAGFMLVYYMFAGLVAKVDSPRASRHYASMDFDGEDLVILSRSGDEQGHTQRAVVGEVAVGRFSVLAERFAVIGDVEHGRVEAALYTLKVMNGLR